MGIWAPGGGGPPPSIALEGVRSRDAGAGYRGMEETLACQTITSSRKNGHAQ